MSRIDDAATHLEHARITTGHQRQHHYTQAWRILEPQARNTARRYNAGSDLDDATAEAALKLWRMIHTWDHTKHGPIGPGATYNAINDAILTLIKKRATYNNATMHLGFDATILTPTHEGHPDPAHQTAVDNEYAAHVHQVARRLAATRPLIWARLLLLVFTTDIRLNQIAEELDRPDGTIRRILKEMRDSGELDELRPHPTPHEDNTIEAHAADRFDQITTYIQLELFAA